MDHQKMESSDFVTRMEQLCEVAPGTLSPSSVIEDIPGWSSLTFLGVIALADESYSVTLKPRQLLGCTTIGDLYSQIKQLQKPK